MKKSLAILLSSLLLLATAACKGDPAPQSGSSSGETTAGSAADTQDNGWGDETGSTADSGTGVITTSATQGAGGKTTGATKGTVTTTTTAKKNTGSNPPAPTTKKNDPDEFQKIANPNVSILHSVSQADYKKLTKEGKTDGIWAAMTDFRRKYGGEVKIEVAADLELVGKLTTLIKSGKAPDLMLLSDQRFPSTAKQELFQPMDSLRDGGGKPVAFKKGLWSPLAMEAYSYKGKVYGIQGVNYQPYVYFLYYNETMFKKEGLTYPKELYKQGKWNWTEFEKACKKLAKDTTGDGKIDQKSFGCHTIIPSIFTMGNDTATVRFDAGGKALANLNDKKTLKALEFLYDALQPLERGGYMDYKDSETFIKDFTEGRMGIMGDVVPTSDVKFDWDVVPFPTGPDNKEKKIVSSVHAYGIPSGAQNPEGAMAYVYLMNDPEKYGKIGAESSIANLSGKTNGKADRAKGEWNYANYINNADLKFSYALDRDFSAVWTIYWNICYDLTAGDKPATVAAKYQNQLQAELDKTYM